MSNQSDKPFGQTTAAISLVAALTCAFATDAATSRSPSPASSRETELSGRVASLVDRVRQVAPGLLAASQTHGKIAQWRNR
jgi:hypothetical protein